MDQAQETERLSPRAKRGAPWLEGEDWSNRIELPFPAVLRFRGAAIEPQASRDQQPAWVGEVLSPSEMTRWGELRSRAVAKRLREWLQGRLAAKEAVQTWLEARGASGAPWTALSLDPDERGKPHAVVQGESGPMALPSISFAHTGGAALAIAGDPSCRVGVDLETVGRLRMERDGFVRLVLDKEEIRWLDEGTDWDARALTLWTLKEAASKAIGTGLMGGPDRFRVTALVEQGQATVVYEQKTVHVRHACFQGFLCAVAYCS